MKSVKFYAVMMFITIVGMVSFTSCDDDNNEEQISGTVTAFDQVRYLQDNIIELDTLGNVKQRVNGAPLNSADTTELYVGVKNINEAAELFKSWLSPDTKVETISPSSVNMQANLTDGYGKAKETVYFKAIDSDGKNIAEMTFASNNTFKHFKKVIFMNSSAWPLKAGISPFNVGEYAEFETNWEGVQKFVCVRAAKEGQAGLMVYLTTKQSHGGVLSVECFASAATALAAANIIKTDWDTFSKYFSNAGMGGKFNQGEFYWYDHYVFFLIETAIYAVRLSDGLSDWFLNRPWVERRGIIIVTFGLVNS